MMNPTASRHTSIADLRLFALVASSFAPVAGCAQSTTASDAGASDVASDRVDASAMFGVACTRNEDCASGLCLAASDLDNGCMGRFCSQMCPMGRGCPSTAVGASDCDPSSRLDAQVCIPRDFEARFCP